MKKVAVFLRGNRRVWNYSKENIFAFCDQLADEVDYYVSMWCVDRSEGIIESMREDFYTRNLKVFKPLKYHWNYDAWTGPAHISSLLNDEKVNEELRTGIQYDAVLDTRPDVVFNQLSKVSKPQPWSVGTTRLEYEEVCGWRGMEDHVFFTDSPTSSLFCNREHYGNNPPVNGHYKLLKYCNITNLTPFQITEFEAKIVRPTIADQYLSIPPNVEMHVAEISQGTWERIDIEERVRLLKKTGIGLDEYTASLNLTV